MKKYILLIAVVIISTNTNINAQSSRRINATSSNTIGDTITFNPMPEHLKSMQYHVTKVAGTIAGKVIYEITVSGTWVPVDTVTLANQPINTKVYFFKETSYLGYRFRYEPTGTQTSTLVVSYLTRDDD